MIDVKKVASLARLSVTAEEEKQYAQQLEAVFEHFQKIEAISTEGVEPMVTPTNVEEFWRDDRAEVEITAEEGLQNAPEKSGSLFKVPPVV